VAKTIVQFDHLRTARLFFDPDLCEAFYRIADHRVLVKPAYLGQPSRRAVILNLGAPGDRSGHGLSGLPWEDYLLTGSVLCAGDDLAPCPHPQSTQPYCLDKVPALRRKAAESALMELAQHFYDFFGRGRDSC
jgi:hypothetical protein